jgi:hypothetical protein
MDDDRHTGIFKLLSLRPLWSGQANHHPFHNDDGAAAAAWCGIAARPPVSLKARMLGGRAETIMRLRGNLR